jgi:hypothetical protein
MRDTVLQSHERLPPIVNSGKIEDKKETAMKNLYHSVACGGMDVHYKFSTVTFRGNAGKSGVTLRVRSVNVWS